MMVKVMQILITVEQNFTICFGYNYKHLVQAINQLVKLKL